MCQLLSGTQDPNSSTILQSSPSVSLLSAPYVKKCKRTQQTFRDLYMPISNLGSMSARIDVTNPFDQEADNGGFFFNQLAFGKTT